MTADAFEWIPFDALTADPDTPPAAWLWDDYLMPGDVGVLTAQPKTGKTTLLIGLMRALARGEPFLGRGVRAGRVWVVSEEPKKLWVERFQANPVGPHARLLPRPFTGLPTPEQWSGLIDSAVASRPNLFVVDSLAHFLPGRSENVSATLYAALHPLRRLTESGVCVLLIHHPRKKPAERGNAARGSGALLAFADVIMELSRIGRSETDPRRRLFARGRRSATPARLDYEWDCTSGVFQPLAEPKERDFAENCEAVLAILGEFGVPLTHTQILERWPEEQERPGRVTLFRWLNKAHERKLVRRDGSGKPTDPWRYRLETESDREQDRIAANIHLPDMPPIRGLNE